jgi:DNA-directed RNA polymerase subunit RPC12/RpoP
MWLLFHRNAKTRPVRGGNSFVETCPECGKRATFVEVEIAESFGVFFVDLVGDKERAYRCGACGETFDLKDQRRPALRSPPSPPGPPRSSSASEPWRSSSVGMPRAPRRHRSRTSWPS